MTTRLPRYLAGFALLIPLLLHSLGLIDWRWLRELEYQLYDVRLRLTAEQGVDPRIIIVDIDEKSLAALGHWPWPRDKLAVIVDRLFSDYTVETLGLDVVLAEPDFDPTLDELKKIGDAGALPPTSPLRQLLQRPSRDELLGAQIQQHNVVLGYVFGRDPSQASTGLLPDPLFPASSGIARETGAPLVTRYSSNIPILQQGQPGGFFSLLDGVDSDGIIRRVPLLNRYEDSVYPALSLMVAASYLGMEISPMLVDSTEDYSSLEKLDLGLFQITLDQDSGVYVPYRAARGLFRRVSAVDVYNGSLDAGEDLAGAIALLGTSAAGLADNRATPIHQVFPGVEIHASLAAGLLDGSLRSHPGWASSLENLLLIVLGIGLVLLLPHLGALALSLVSLGAAALVVGGNLWLWIRHDFVLALAPLLMAIFLVYAANMLFGYLAETRTRLQLRRSFGLYVPPQIIEKMQGQSVQDLLRSEKKEMTVLFTDIRGFTTISEQLSPEALSQLMNAFLTPMTAIVHRHGGAIDKYMGDAMMAFWGAPMDDPDHAANALGAALEMMDALETLNQEFEQREWPQVRIGIGLNTGPMSVGNMGSAFRMAYTVLGDAVNLGSRLEGLTAKYGVPILISETTAARCPDMSLVLLDRVRVKGKQEPVGIFMPLGLKGAVPPAREERMQRFADFQAQYFNRDWEEAIRTLQSLRSDSKGSAYVGGAEDDALFELYLERTRMMQQSPPAPDWDGVTDFLVK